MHAYFDHEKLEVYQEAIAFVAWWTEIRPRCSSAPNVQDQMDRASTSSPLNIAEGNGKYSMRDRCRYLQIASGSALECAACLDVFVARRCLRPQEAEVGKQRLQRIVAMLIGLMNRLSNRVAEGESEYDRLGSPDSGPACDRPVAGTPTLTPTPTPTPTPTRKTSE